MSELFEKTEINGMSLSNRFIRSATWDGLAADDGACTRAMIDLMARLSKGGVGMIITGHAYIHPHGQHQPWQLGIHRDELITGLRKMTGVVHENDVRIVLQLGYGGAYLSKSRVRQMSVRDMEELVKDFGRAALRAKKAGFDGVQIFAAHGFFLSQLLCPRYNDRNDKFGVSIENRARALLEILQSVREAVGLDYPVLAKLNCQDFVENGLTLEDSIQVGLMLEQGGIDAIELSGGLLNNPNLMNDTEGKADEVYFRKEARAFKEKIDVPLILVGGIRSFSTAESLLDENIADYISMCRPFIREPDLINRWKSGDHRKAVCISCNNCVEQAKKGDGITCVPMEETAPQTFFPQDSEIIRASPPHRPGTGYKISVGLEERESNFMPVVKIQMVYDGIVKDVGPSFPLGSEDHDRVNKAIGELLEKQGSMQAKD
ncbi:MAG: NADH:flavin oxidoreductase [Deltaproteobacteria bacterium]|nr:NADH:flavin oxidoreductase [Deltaproteobacteria bacterium]